LSAVNYFWGMTAHAVTPPFLEEGSIIGITCPSGYVSAERVRFSAELFKKWGYEVKMGRTVGSEFHYFSGTDAERLNDLQDMLDDPDVDAIMMGRGGYGMSRIIDGLDFSKFQKNPKWICGFSDITVIHHHIQAQFGIQTLHSPMCGHFKETTEHEAYVASFRDAIAGNALQYSMPTSTYNRRGIAEGVVTGGNLSLLVHLTGSVSEVNMDGMILFIEDLGEHLYAIDRMLMHLKRAGKLSKLAGLLVGGFTDLEDTERPFGQTVEEIIYDKVREYSYPVCFNFPAGHQDVNYTLTLGARHKLAVADGSSSMLVKL